MKHDPDLIRHILEHAASHAAPDKPVENPAPATHAPEAVDHHVALLIEHKLIDGHAAEQGKPHGVRTLTAEGHDLLRALRDKGVQEKLRHAGAHLGEGVTIHVILDIAKVFLLGF